MRAILHKCDKELIVPPCTLSSCTHWLRYSLAHKCQTNKLDSIQVIRMVGSLVGPGSSFFRVLL